MNKNLSILIFILFVSIKFVFSQCNGNVVSSCAPSIAGPFNFVNATPGVHFRQGCLNLIPGTNRYGFITLTITESGPLNLLINGNTTNGFLDVIVYNVPGATSPCAASLIASNQIGCNYADFGGGCVQFGNAFPCNSTVNAPVVNVDDVIVIIVQDWSNANTSFTLQLGPGAQSGLPNSSINPPSDMIITQPPQTVTSVNGGGTWSSSCGSCINASGQFNAATAGEGQHEIYYSIGNPPCNSVDTAIINVDLCATTVASFSTDVNCFGGNNGSAYVTVSGGTTPYSYQWSPTASSDSVISNLTAGTYTVQVTDATFCTITRTIIIEQPEELNITLSSDSTICFGESSGKAYVASISGGTEPYSYQWNDISSQTTDTAFNLPEGLYELSVTDANLCTYNATSINVWNKQDITFATDVSPILCYSATNNGSATVVNLAGGSAPYTFLWSDVNNQTTQTAQGLGTGTYTVIVSDVNGCTNSDSVDIILPTEIIFSVSTEDALCFNEPSGKAFINSVTGGSPPYIYSWSSTIVQTTDTAFNLIQGNYTITVTDSNACSVTQNFSIDAPLDLTNTFSLTNISCNSGLNGSIASSVSGGIPPYTYSWSNGATTADISNLAAGTYTLVYTDANGCSKTEVASLTEPLALTLTTNITNISCKDLNDGTANVTAVGGTAPYTYLWSNNSSTASISNLTPGLYSVTVTDTNLCEAVASVTITEPDSLIASVNSITNVLCNGNNTGLVNISVVGGTPTYTYNWSTGNSNQNLNNALAGNYTLIVTDANNCTSNISATITQPDALTVLLSGTNINCFGGSDGLITSTVNGGVAPYSYLWSNGGNLSSINNLVAGTYNLTVTDANGCTQTASTTLTQPQDVIISFTNSNVLCFEGNSGSSTVNITSGGTAPFTYQWDSNANNQTSQTAGGLQVGSYSVIVSDANGCSYSASTTIQEPTELIAISSFTDISCAGLNNGSANVVASGGTPPYNYLWNNPSATTTAQVSNLSPGVYQVNVTDINNCLAIANVTIIEPPQIVVLVETDSANCWGETTGALTVLASGGTNSALGFTYSIDGGNTFQESNYFSNLSAGVYPQIIVKDLGSSENCLSNLAGATIFQPNPMFVAIVPEDTTLQLQESVDLLLNVDTSQGYDINSISSIVWTPNDGLSCSDCINPTVLTYNDFNVYEATIYYNGVNSAVCNTTASTLIKVENNLKFFIPNAFTPNGDGTNDFLFVYGESLKDINLQIYNRWGEKIFQSNNQLDGWDGTFKGNVVAPGVYTYFFEGEYLDGKKIAQKGSISVLR